MIVRKAYIYQGKISTSCLEIFLRKEYPRAYEIKVETTAEQCRTEPRNPMCKVSLPLRGICDMLLANQ